MKLAKLLIVVISVLFFAVAANAGTLTYSPNSFSLTVEAGASQTVAFQTTLTGSTVTKCNLEYSLVGLPSSWAPLLSGSINRVWGRYATLPLQLTLTVPGDAAPGEYKGYLIPSVTTSPAETITVGSGIQISVTVPGASCKAAPEFTGISYPAESWSPSDKAVNVAISGTCIVPEKCNVTTWYVVDDEYGVYSSREDQKFSLASDGSFSVSVPIEASRRGDDKDGRLYTITFYAENEAGKNESSVFVRIAHDQGKK